MADEWGPWIQHDGRGCPIKPGQFVHVKAISAFGKPQEEMGCPARIGDRARAWVWSFYRKRSPYGYNYSKIIRYRIRKPRGLTILEDLIADLPEPVRELTEAHQ